MSNDINTTEDMLALGLESHMVGDFGVNGDGPAGKPVPSSYLAAFHKVKDISPGYFTLEKLVSLHPDFLFAGWNYGLQAGSNLTPTNLAKYHIDTLALTESCAHVQASKQSVSIEDTYTDLTDLGEIFGVETKANALIASMKAQVAAAQAKVGSLAPVTVFDYDSGTSAPFTGPGLAMPNALITDGGGTNIFAGLKQSWTSVSWEQVVAADPQCIIINDYGTPTAAQKEKFLETSKITKNLTAVKNKCFLSLSYDEVTPESSQRGGRRQNRQVAPPVRLRVAGRRLVTADRPPARALQAASSLTRTLDRVGELVSYLKADIGPVECTRSGRRQGGGGRDVAVVPGPRIRRHVARTGDRRHRTCHWHRRPGGCRFHLHSGICLSDRNVGGGLPHRRRRRPRVGARGDGRRSRTGPCLQGGVPRTHGLRPSRRPPSRRSAGRAVRRPIGLSRWSSNRWSNSTCAH